MNSKKAGLSFLIKFFFGLWVFTILLFVACIAYFMLYPYNPSQPEVNNSELSSLLSQLAFYDFFVGVGIFLVLAFLFVINLLKNKYHISVHDKLTQIFKLSRFKKGVLTTMLLIAIGSWSYAGNSIFKTFNSVSPVSLESEIITNSPSPEINWSAEILRLVNAERANNNLPELKENTLLTDSSSARGDYLFETKNWSSTAPKGKDFEGLMISVGYNHSEAGESLGKDYDTPNDLFQSLMDSKENKANILNKNFKDIGISIKEGDFDGMNTKLVVVHFGSAYPPPTQSTKKTVAVDPDPIVNCNYDHLGSKQVRKSVCSKSFECQIGGQWYIYDDNKKCADDQKKSQPSQYVQSNPAPYPSYTYQEGYTNCTIYNAQTGKSEFYYLKISECTSKTNAQTQANSDYYAAKKVNDGETAELEQQHSQACQLAVAEWQDIKQNFYATEYGNYSSSYEAVLALDQMKRNYQQQMNNAGCQKTIY